MAILDATLKLLETTPVSQISIESIAREAGVGKATIYRWWNSKAAVVIEAFLHTHLSHTPMPKDVSPRDALMRHIHLLVEEYSGWSGRIVSQIMAEGQSDPDVLREFRERFWYGRRAVVREVVEDARRKGEFRNDVETELQMDILYAPIYFRLLMRHLPLDKVRGRTLRHDDADAGTHRGSNFCGVAQTAQARLSRLPAGEFQPPGKAEVSTSCSYVKSAPSRPQRRRCAASGSIPA